MSGTKVFESGRGQIFEQGPAQIARRQREGGRTPASTRRARFADPHGTHAGSIWPSRLSSSAGSSSEAAVLSVNDAAPARRLGSRVGTNTRSRSSQIAQARVTIGDFPCISCARHRFASSVARFGVRSGCQAVPDDVGSSSTTIAVDGLTLVHRKMGLSHPSRHRSFSRARVTTLPSECRLSSLAQKPRRSMLTLGWSALRSAAEGESEAERKPQAPPGLPRARGGETVAPPLWGMVSQFRSRFR